MINQTINLRTCTFYELSIHTTDRRHKSPNLEIILLTIENKSSTVIGQNKPCAPYIHLNKLTYLHEPQ